MDIRKTMIMKETIEADGVGEVCTPITRVVAAAVIRNPFTGRFVEDLSLLFDIGGQLGERLMGDAVEMLSGPPVSYGKAAIVGVAGDLEHGGAMIHPTVRVSMSRSYWLVKSDVTLRGQNYRKKSHNFPVGNFERENDARKSDRFLRPEKLRHLHRPKERLTKCASGGHQKKRIREKRTTRTVQTVRQSLCCPRRVHFSPVLNDGWTADFYRQLDSGIRPVGSRRS